MVVQEVLRIRPSVYFLPRTAIEDDEINGYRIAAGQMVAVGIYNIHHDPNVWENPGVFDPERFSSEHSEKRHQLAWMPFGAGGHLCLGRDFSLMESTLVLAMMVQRYKFGATNRVATMALSTALRPQGGVWATLSKRA
jgi:cytochrome P450